ncbi:MAG: response regulator transcription factor [Flavisolibacter sp.]|jgi:DNA-binding response OmpR family regulator|nr:response regulator transcription factor [Flavisolibacter sp.]
MSKILSVNGNKAMNFLLKTVFEGEFTFIPVADAFQAIYEMKHSGKIGALIVDVDFQPQQSWELVQHIKSSKLLNIPVVILASENSDELKLKSYEYEVDEIFFKPFNPVDLITAVRNLEASEVMTDA